MSVKKCLECGKEIIWRYTSYPRYCKDCSLKVDSKNKQKHYHKNRKILLKEYKNRYHNDYEYREYRKMIRKKWYEKNMKTNGDELRKYWREWRMKNKDKKKDKIRSLSYKIIILKGYKCQICKKRLAIERHHENYSKPLEVILCCKSCHYELDKLKRTRDEKINDKRKYVK